jgi:hypothetical protein
MKTIQLPQTETTEQENKHEQRVEGLLLIALGSFFLIAQFLQLGMWTLVLLGAGFTLWGLFSRSAGPLIPGGILNGIALGSFFMNSPFLELSEQASGGMFLLGFALGWLSIELLSTYFTSEPQDWAKIPAGILAAIGVLTLLDANGFKLLTLFGSFWPVLLIVGGVLVLIKTRHASRE